MVDIKESPYGVCFHSGKVSHLGKKIIFASMADGILYKMDKHDKKEKECQILWRQGETLLKNSYFIKSLPDILALTF